MRHAIELLDQQQLVRIDGEDIFPIIDVLDSVQLFYKYSIKVIGKNILHCVKSVLIRSYSSPYFPAFGLNTDQNNSEYGHSLRSVNNWFI